MECHNITCLSFVLMSKVGGAVQGSGQSDLTVFSGKIYFWVVKTVIMTLLMLGHGSGYFSVNEITKPQKIG